MSVHVKPERWADLLANRVDVGERAKMVVHAQSCAACASARRQVDGISGTFSAIRDQPDVELYWEQLQAQVGWAAASEIRRGRAPSWLSSWFGGWRWAYAGVAVACAVALSWWTLRDASTTRLAKAEAVVETVEADAVVPDVVALDGVVTLLEGAVRIDGQPATLDTEVRAGQTIVTGTGRLAVQLGAHTGFVVEPQSQVVIDALDGSDVKLHVQGGVHFEVQHRVAAQRFAVWAGTRRVEVRGTKFSVVDRDGDLDVVVSRGRVAVIEGESAVDVPAGARVSLAKGVPVSGAVLAALSPSLLVQLEESMRVPTLMSWTDAEQTRSQSARLRIDGKHKTRVRVDGIAVGTGSLTMRTAPGRHLVEAGARSRWLEVAPGATSEAVLIESQLRSSRPRQFDEQLGKQRRALAVCGDRMRKFDPSFRGAIQVEAGINADGSIDFVDARKGLPDRGIEDCVLDLVRDRFVLPPGDKATVRKTIRF